MAANGASVRGLDTREKLMKLWRYGQPVEYLGHRYRLDGMLGSGGMADVCLGWDEREQREVALKILKSDDLDQETLNRFMKEAAQIAHWRHPHILRVYESLQVELIDAASGSVLFYMVSEYARGGDLQKRLAPGRPFPLAATFALFRQLCDAVQYAHERGVIHRDLKPLNMLFRRPEQGPEELVLSDFGLAVQVEASHHTFAHGGTLAYMAPEQFQGHAQPASDIFALGVILYLLCTGGLPFRRTLQDMPRLVMGTTPIPTKPSLLNRELPPLLDEVILRALRELPAERYRQPRAFWEALEFALTTSARTMPYVAEFWQAAGQTWPYDGASQTPSMGGAMLTEIPAPSEQMEWEQEQPEVKEGPVSALWIAREKQKASPVRLPLPTHSIPAEPNPDPAHTSPQALSQRQAGGEAPTPQEKQNQGEARLLPPGMESSSFHNHEVDTSLYIDDESETQARPLNRPARTPRSTHRPRAKRAIPPRASSPTTPASWDEGAEWKSDEEALPPAWPTSSLSGSTVLPQPRRSTTREGQTSLRQPFEAPDTFTNETGQRRPSSSTGPYGQTYRPFDESSEPAHSAQSYTTGRDVFARSIPRRQSGSAIHPISASPTRARSTLPATRGQRVPGQVQRSTRTRRRPALLVLVGGVLLLVLLLAILSATALQGRVLTFLGAPVTTVTLQTRAQLLQETTTLTLLTDGTQPAANEIPGRQLTATAPSQSAIAHASGAIPGTHATGKLTFLNNGDTDITLQGTTISDDNGVQVSFQGPITIPAAPPSSVIVTGIVVQAGKVGNIPVLDIVKQCCAPNVVVKNTTAFTGGQDAQPNSVIQQGDIDGATQPLIANGEAQAKGLLGQQVRANERVVAPAQCQAQTSSTRKAGDIAKQSAVQVAVTCSESVYNLDAARSFFAQDLQRSAQGNPALGANSALVGQLDLTLLSATPASAGNAQNTTLQFHAQGLWAYHFTPATLQHLAGLIAGKSQDAARALLLSQPGISAVQFSRDGSLPVNTSEIQLDVATPAKP